jgi:hypothetical protein
MSEEAKMGDTKSQSRFIRSLRLCGGVSLLLGIVGALLVLWGMSQVYQLLPSGTSTLYLTYDLAYAFLIALLGLVVFVLFNVLAGMAENLIAIREKLSDK